MAVIRGRGRRGALTADAALFLPILVLLLLSGAESGWHRWRTHQIHLAAHQGARVAASDKGTEALARVAVEDFLRRAGLGDVPCLTAVQPADVTVLAPGRRVEVVVTVRYADVSLTGFSRLPFVPEEIRCAVWVSKRGPHRPSQRSAVAVEK